MAPGKFGLFKSRSREQPEQPSTENLLKSSESSDDVTAPGSPIPSTSRGLVEDTSPADILSILSLESEDEISVDNQMSRRDSQCSKEEQEQIEYNQFENPSVETSTLTLNEIDPDFQDSQSTFEFDDASTCYDANSLQFDETSIAASDDTSLYCSMMKKSKKTRKEQRLNDFDMWQASNVEVMQNLLSRSGTLDELIKWEAIANSRGLCNLTDTCNCEDCLGAKYLAGMTDGDGGLGTAPLFSAINVGCQIQ